MKHWLRSQTQPRKPYTRSKEEEVVDKVVEEDEETTEEMEPDHMVVSVPRCGADGATPIPTISRIAGRRMTITTNGHEMVTKTTSLPAMDAEKSDMLRETVQRGEMETEMEAEAEAETEEEMEAVTETEMDSMDQAMEAEAASMAKAKETGTDPKDKVAEMEMEEALDLVGELETRDKSSLKMVRATSIDSRGRPPSTQR